MAHLMLKNFLNNNIQKEMDKYNQVEQSFNKIKAETGISDAQEFVNKFLFRE